MKLLTELSTGISLESAKDTVLISVSSKTTWGGLFGSIYGWLTQSDSAIFVGILVTIMGFCMNYFFQRRKSKKEDQLFDQKLQAYLRAEERKEEIHAARLLAIKQGKDLDLMGIKEEASEVGT